MALSPEKNTTTRKLRVGVLVNSDLIPSWANAMLQQIANGDYAEIVVFIKNAAYKSKETGGFLQKAIKYRKHLFYMLLMKIDRQFGRNYPDPDAPVNIQEVFDATPYISIAPEETRFSHRLRPEDAERIQSYRLDVAIRIGFKILRGNFLKCARYGVWSYHHGDNRINRGVPPGFWEVFERWPVTGVIVQILTEDLDSGSILRRSYSQTDPSLVIRNYSRHYWKAVSLLPRALKELHRLGPEAFFVKVNKANRHPEFYSHPLRTLPTNAKVFSLALSHYARCLWEKILALFYRKQWILLYDLARGEQFSRSFWRFKKLVPPKNLCWADPFVLFRNDRHYVFLQQRNGAANQGHIAYIILNPDGRPSEARKILEKPYPLSYPFVFHYEGVDYMIPESGANSTVDLYSCIAFPDRWEYRSTLLQGVRAVGATMLRHDGWWWLFTNIRERPGASFDDELFLFYNSDLLSGSWTPHPLNPIVSDARSARPAGRIFEHNGNLYRPSRDNSGSGMNGMKINHIVNLSTTCYEEVCVNDIGPLWDSSIVQMNTINYLSGLTIIDGLMKRRKFFG
jgi:hypothetical protein